MGYRVWSPQKEIIKIRVNIYSKFVMCKLYTLSFACDSCWKFSMWVVVFFFFCNIVVGGCGLLQWLRGKESTTIQEIQEMWVQSLVGKIPWRRKWQLTPVSLQRAFRQRNLAGYSRAAALDRTEPCMAGRPGAQGSVSPPLPRTRVLTLLSRAGLSPGLWPIEGETANIASWQKVQCPATLGLSSAWEWEDRIRGAPFARIAGRGDPTSWHRPAA